MTPAGIERDFQTADEVIDVRHVSENVVPEEEVSGPAIDHELFRGLRAEEFYDAGNLLLLPCDLGDVGRRLHPEDGDALGFEVLEQVTVVAGDFDNLARFIETEALCHHLAVASRVLHPTRRITREVEVIAEDIVGRLEFLQLRE